MQTQQKIYVKKLKCLFLKKGKKEKIEGLSLKSCKMLFFDGYKPNRIFVSAFNKIKPLFEIKPKKVRGVFYDVPYPLTHDTQVKKAVQKIANKIFLTPQKLEKSFVLELKEIYHNRSDMVREMETLHTNANQYLSFLYYKKKRKK